MTASTGEPRRVLILVENLPVPFDRRVWQIATTLAGNGYAVTVICPTGKGATERAETIDGVRIWRYRQPIEASGIKGYLVEYPVALWHQLRLAWRAWRRGGFDVVHACNPPDLLFLVGGLFKLLFGTKFVFDHHDINPELYEAKFGRRDLFYRLLVLLERLTFRSADIVISTNCSYRDIAIARGGVAPERIFVVRSGPSLERLRPVPPDPALKRGRRYLVGYVGVMGYQEGLDLLLEAVRHIVFALGRRDIQFGLVGAGPELDRLRAMAAALGIADWVTFTGRVADAELLAMLSTADLCVNPDRVNPMNDKSTMNKVMEYMALGKALVQFDMTEGSFSAGEASLYARPNDVADLAARIVELVDDPERRRRMGEIGRRRVVDALAWPHEVPKLLAAYDSLWRGPDPAPDEQAEPRRLEAAE